MNHRWATAPLLLLLTVSQSLWAGATAEQVTSLGGETYTPVGAERAGNAEGTIPAWQDGLSEIPVGDIDSQGLLNPFADEKPLFRIDASNAQQYAQQLSPGQLELLKRYPDSYYFPVYPGHRVSTYPTDVLEQVKRSAAGVELVEGGNGLRNLNGTTVPFPFPDSALEVIWNHITRYRGGSVERTYSLIPVQANGVFSPVVFQDLLVFGSHFPAGEVSPNRLFLYLSRILEPARLEGDVRLVHENIDQVAEPRNAWVYNAGQRRVRRAPNLSYDGPGFAADALSTTDDLDAYNGAPDRYNWELLGKQELYGPTNAYQFHSKTLKYKDLIMPGHLNPEHTRYELRRVWVVQATLKPGERHVYAKRVFYVDEDSWGVVVKDQYDGRGELWRVGQSHNIFHYQAKVPWGSDVMNDLVSGRYLITGLSNEIPNYAYVWGNPAKAADFTPAALRRTGRR
ncbi:DUF1329 domain-containing protein [Halieaceae bacterium IMCC14734]|uniref:DUF1329 domain-containing protein n=1 Tax=Candidatus Litorirhabdus singularis TaxID=2518993 RepID=A0ABT3TJX0_9GAMM|nr:DUF1329 domain-containing protein [Candidatus Litorirhabdus singularis]MCX2982615.1 DUF1329 domain-containing protein [Candidatus Litorirhabdus singularis]